MEYFLSKIIKRPKIVTDVRDQTCPRVGNINQSDVDEAKKSPKQFPLKDEPATANESSNLSKNLPDIIATVGDIKEDEDFIHSTPLRVAPTRNRLKTATPDEHQSEDELFFDCNTTLRNTTKASVLNETIDNVSAILNEASQILDEQGLSDSGTQTPINPNETVIVSRRENLNDGFINVTESSAGNLETNHGQFHATDLNISTKNENQVAVQQQSEDIKQLTLPNQRSCVSALLIGDIKSAAPTHNATDAGTQFVDDQKQENTSISATADSNKLNETVDIVPNVDLQQKEPIDFTFKKVNSEAVSFDVLSSVGPSNDHLVNIANDQTRIQNHSGDIQQSAESNQASFGYPTISETDVNNAAANDIRGIDAQSVYKLLQTVQDYKVESIKLNETVNIVAADDNQKGVEAETIPSTPCEKLSFVAQSNEKLTNVTNDLEGYVPVVTHINDLIDVVPSGNYSKPAVELKNLSKTNSPKEEVEDGTCYQESTFILSDNPSDSSIALTSNLDQKTEVVASNENVAQNTERSALKQAEKIREFEKNQTISVDSLDRLSETRDCSLDSIEMKKPLQHQPILPSDGIVTSGKTDEIMIEKDVPAVSETLANTEHSFNESNEPAICDHLLPQDSPIRKMSIKSEVPLMSDNIQNVNQSDFVFKSPLLPISTVVAKMENQQFQGGDSDFMVLNSNDFDFLQSRGGNSVDPEDDRRNSLLLRFDPLVKSRSSIIPFTPAVQRVEESAEAEPSLNHIEPLVDLCSNALGENNLYQQKIFTAKPPSTNEPAMSIGLIDNSNSMDNEAEAYVNNIKSDRTEDKHMQIDGVPLTDKKIKFKYTDGNIQKKMEEYEATQELLLKRITEKDKTVSKNCAIIEAYEKALAELVVEKEKLTENCEINNEKLRQERDIHYQHLMSLETTFSDLHMKYERSKEFILQLQDRLDCVTEEKTKIDELLKQQEMRYEKMKEHALHQLESANATLEDQDKNNTRENSRLKGQLKIEEVTRSTFQEQLFQKKKENEELVKICDELIGGQKS